MCNWAWDYIIRRVRCRQASSCLRACCILLLGTLLLCLVWLNKSNIYIPFEQIRGIKSNVIYFDAQNWQPHQVNWTSDGMMTYGGVTMTSNLLDAHQVVAHDAGFRPHQFNSEEGDVFVFLHIQKTGGKTFNSHLVTDLQYRWPCSCSHPVGLKSCRCITSQREGEHAGKTWLVSRDSWGWRCGVHPDWTQLNTCLHDRLGNNTVSRYLTILREPVSRYLSEWRHVQRGANWNAKNHQCAGKKVNRRQLRPCSKSPDFIWRNVSLEDFMECESNLALNRQTRMLADLRLVGCYDVSAMPRKQRELTLLASAMHNLHQMDFLGLTEYQAETQQLFERTFGLSFKDGSFNKKVNTKVGQMDKNHLFSDGQLARVREVNHLDIRLYQYAKDLFFRRLDMSKKQGISFRNKGDGGSLQ